MDSEQLTLLRKNLAQCDEVILNALLMRNRIVDQIMVYKEANKMTILQPEREAETTSWLEKRLENADHKKEVTKIYDTIRECSKRIQSRRLFDYNILLIGFMGSGKSTVSHYLNMLFAMDVVEMDEYISQSEGMSIPDIFELRGEEYFRDLETNLLIELQSKKNTVISCGGGVPMRERNVTEMKKNGKVVLLTASPENILDRVKDDHNRPLIENNKNVTFINDLMEKRRAKYEAAADYIIDTNGKDAYTVCREIVKALQEK